MNSDKNPNPHQQLKDLINQSHRILFACGKNAQLDSVAATLGLSSTLEDLGKVVSVVCPDKLSEEVKSLVGWEKITTDLAKNFVITLTSAVGNIEKVSYYLEGDDLNLVIRPHPQAPPFSPDQVKYKEGGGDYDLIVVLGSKELSDLGKIYTDEEAIFLKTAIVNIDRQKDNNQFGKVNLVYPKASSISEIVTRLFKSLGMKLNQGVATNLLTGLIWATNDFHSPDTSAETFEAAAFCLRSGAQRLDMTSRPKKPSPTEETALLEEGKKKEKTSVSQENTQPDKDWLEPKVYQGGRLV